MCDKTLYNNYLCIMNEELIPAMGCTEPIAIAYAAALARKTLGNIPERADICVSGNILKNTRSVIVPHTGSLRGIKAAAAAGIIAGDADKRLEVISEVDNVRIDKIAAYLKSASIKVEEARSDTVFLIEITVYNGTDSAFVRIVNEHTNVVLIQKNDEDIYSKEYCEETISKTGHSLLTVEQIIEFADNVDIGDVDEMITRQIEYNTAIAEEGLRGNYGANIGRILLKEYGDSVSNRARAWAAAGSDARMNGCEMPVVINSGSGNQGMTASLPVIVYAKEMNATREMLYRSLVVSNLITIHLKSGIGCLSAYCGVISAGCGAGAGITYLCGGRYTEIAHTIVNALAINSGVICDGAKASCAAKIASAVDAGLLGMQMYKNGSEFHGGDGIVTKGVEATIKNINRLACEGMKETDRTIIQIMTR